MTQQYELPSDIELDESVLFELEQFITRNDTTMQEEDEEQQQLEDNIFVSKQEFSEQLTKKIVKLTDSLGLDDDSFAQVGKLDSSVIDEVYRFTLPTDMTLFCLTANGLYTQTFLLGGTEEFFPHGVSVDVNSNRVIVRMRPLFASMGKFFDFYLLFEDDQASATAKEREVDEALNRYIFELFTVDYNRLTREIRRLVSEHRRAAEYAQIKNTYKDKDLQVW